MLNGAGKICSNIQQYKIICAVLLIWCFLFLSGCEDSKTASLENRQIFENAGTPSVTSQADKPARFDYVYRVVSGDVIEIHMPTVMRQLSPDALDEPGEIDEHLARVSDEGMITVPIAGRIKVAGMTASEIEESVVNAYYPKYVKHLPAVVTKVVEHRNLKGLSVVGLVRKPDSFEYPPDAQYTLIDAIAMAGGVDLIADPHYATVFRQDHNGQIVSSSFRIDKKYLAQTSNVLIKPGDIVSVDRTMRTQFNRAVAEIVDFRVGANFGL